MECYLVVLGMAVAAGLFRRSPEAALALVWLSCAFQVLAGLDVMLVQLAVTIVSFGCARYGRTAVVWLSGLSIPAAAVIGITYVTLRGPDILDSLGGVGRIAADSYYVRPTLVLGVSALVPLVIPWLVGLMLRISEQARTSREAQHTAEEARSQAEEIAHLREEQARMARDVHDVVGHSLAVILAQAESAQFIKDADTQALKQTMENIATSARSSLQDVRQVLTADHGPAAQRGDRRPGQPDRGGAIRRLRGGLQRGRDAAAAAARARGRGVPGAPGDAHQRDQVRSARRAGQRRAALGG